MDHAAGACDARLDPALAGGASCSGRSSTRPASATTPSPSPASPGRSTSASGWCGSAPSCCSARSGAIGGDFRHHRFRHAGRRRNTSTCGTISAREDRGHRRHRVRRVADLRHDPRLVQRRMLNYFAVHTKLPGQPASTLQRRRPAWCGSPPATISFALLSLGFLSRGHRGALHALHRRPAFLRRRHRLGAGSLRIPTRC